MNTSAPSATPQAPTAPQAAPTPAELIEIRDNLQNQSKDLDEQFATMVKKGLNAEVKGIDKNSVADMLFYITGNKDAYNAKGRLALLQEIDVNYKDSTSARKAMAEKLLAMITGEERQATNNANAPEAQATPEDSPEVAENTLDLTENEALKQALIIIQYSSNNPNTHNTLFAVATSQGYKAEYDSNTETFTIEKDGKKAVFHVDNKKLYAGKATDKSKGKEIELA